MIFGQNCRSKRFWSNCGLCPVNEGQVATISCYAKAEYSRDSRRNYSVSLLDRPWCGIK